VIFKVKHPKFFEMIGKPPRDATLEAIALCMLTETRLFSVLSKLTLDERANSEKVAELLVLDAIADAEHYRASKAMTAKGKTAHAAGTTNDSSPTSTSLMDSLPAETRAKLLEAAKAIVKPSK
jgi:hypothetical protein